MKPTKTTNNPETMEAFLAGMEHPLKQEIQVLRGLILGLDPSINESIKWNAPSFFTSEHFATFHLRAKKGVQVVLHFGAKPRPDLTARAEISDPASLLDWRAPDRATVTFLDLQEIEAKRGAFVDLLRQWITFI